jgi:hypothetical protein
MRFKLNAMTDQHIFGRLFSNGLRIEPNGAGSLTASMNTSSAYTGSQAIMAAGTWVTGTWYSIWANADLDFTLPGSRAVQLVRNGSLLAQGVAGTSTAGEFRVATTQPSTLGGTPDTPPGYIANADFDLFIAFFLGTAFDASNPTVWEEVFDPTNGHAIRPEYLNGTKTTIGGLAPTSYFRGPGIITGTNLHAGGPTWSVIGVQQEAVYA